MISCIRCYRVVKTTTMYFVEGVVSEHRNKIETCLPWVFNGWSLPRSIELDKGLDDTWSVYGIEVIWKTTESKAKKGHKLKVGRLLNATPSAHGNNEFDLHVGLWVSREVLETFAPSLLDSKCSDEIWSLGELI